MGEMRTLNGTGTNVLLGVARAILFLIVASGCAAAAEQEERANGGRDEEKRREIERMYKAYRESFPMVPDILPSEARTLMKSGRAVFVDIREPEEQAVSMLPGALKETDFLANPEIHSDKVVIGYCTISFRSGKLAKKLAKQGIRMHNLRGGILAWVHDGGKVFDHHGETRRVHVYGRKWNLVPEHYEPVW